MRGRDDGEMCRRRQKGARRKAGARHRGRGERGARRGPTSRGGRAWAVEWDPTGDRNPAVGGGESSVGPVYREWAWAGSMAAAGEPVSSQRSHQAPDPGLRGSFAVRRRTVRRRRLPSSVQRRCARASRAAVDFRLCSGTADGRQRTNAHDRRRRRAPGDPAGRRPDPTPGATLDLRIARPVGRPAADRGQ